MEVDNNSDPDLTARPSIDDAANPALDSMPSLNLNNESDLTELSSDEEPAPLSGKGKKPVKKPVCKPRAGKKRKQSATEDDNDDEHPLPAPVSKRKPKKLHLEERLDGLGMSVIASLFSTQALEEDLRSLSTMDLSSAYSRLPNLTHALETMNNLRTTNNWVMSYLQCSPLNNSTSLIQLVRLQAAVAAAPELYNLWKQLTIINRATQWDIARIMLLIYDWLVDTGRHLANALVEAYKDGVPSLRRDFPAFAKLTEHAMLWADHVCLQRAAKGAGSVKIAPLQFQPWEVDAQSPSPDWPPSNLSQVPRDLYGLRPVEKTKGGNMPISLQQPLLMKFVPNSPESVRDGGRRILYTLLAHEMIVLPMSKIDELLITKRHRKDLQYVHARLISRGALLHCLVDVCQSEDVLALPLVKQVLTSPSSLLSGTSDAKFMPDILTAESLLAMHKKLEPFRAELCAQLEIDEDIPFYMQEIATHIHRCSLQFEHKRPLTDEQILNPHLLNHVPFLSRKGTRQSGTTRNLPILQSSAASLMPDASRMPTLLAVPAVLIREGLCRSNNHPPADIVLHRILTGLHPRMGTASHSNLDHVDTMRLCNINATLVLYHFRNNRITEPLGLSNIGIWMVTGQGFGTQKFLEQGNFWFASGSECVARFTAVQQSNESIVIQYLADHPRTPEALFKRIPGYIVYNDPNVWGQASNALKLNPTIPGTGGAMRKTNDETIAPIFAPDMSAKWSRWLGKLAGKDPASFTGVRHSWTEAIDFIVSLEITGMKDKGLTTLQCANNLVILGVCTPPSPEEMAAWIAENGSLGAFNGLLRLGFSLTMKDKIGVRAAFLLVYRHLDKHMTKRDKETTGFGAIFVENFLCKVERWEHRFEEAGMPQSLQQTAIHTQENVLTVLTAPDDELLPLIELYWSFGFSDPVIAHHCMDHFDRDVYGLSKTTVKRRRVRLKLKGTRKEAMTWERLQPIYTKIRARFPSMGARAMVILIRQQNKIKVSEGNLARFLRTVEGDQVMKRKARRFKRKQFHCAGLHDVWTFDQHDKWKRFNLFLHIGIEPCSGTILWLKIWWTNRNPILITSYYLEVARSLQGKVLQNEMMLDRTDAVKIVIGIPMLSQSDPGSENFGIAYCHTTTRQTLDPALQGTLQHRWTNKHKGSNIKPEIGWLILRRTFTEGFESILQWGVDHDLYDTDNRLHKWLAIPWLQSELDSWRARFNSSPRRHDPHKVLPQGIPDLIRAKPADYNVQDFKIPVSPELFDDMETTWAPPSNPVFQLVPDTFGKYANVFYVYLSSPVVTSENFWDVYNHLLGLFEGSFVLEDPIVLTEMSNINDHMEFEMPIQEHQMEQPPPDEDDSEDDTDHILYGNISSDSEDDKEKEWPNGILQYVRKLPPKEGGKWYCPDCCLRYNAAPGTISTVRRSVMADASTRAAPVSRPNHLDLANVNAIRKEISKAQRGDPTRQIVQAVPAALGGVGSAVFGISAVPGGGRPTVYVPGAQGGTHGLYIPPPPPRASYPPGSLQAQHMIDSNVHRGMGYTAAHQHYNTERLAMQNKTSAADVGCLVGLKVQLQFMSSKKNKPVTILTANGIEVHIRIGYSDLIKKAFDNVLIAWNERMLGQGLVLTLEDVQLMKPNESWILYDKTINHDLISPMYRAEGDANNGGVAAPRAKRSNVGSAAFLKDGQTYKIPKKAETLTVGLKSAFGIEWESRAGLSPEEYGPPETFASFKARQRDEVNQVNAPFLVVSKMHAKRSISTMKEQDQHPNPEENWSARRAPSDDELPPITKTTGKSTQAMQGPVNSSAIIPLFLNNTTLYRPTTPPPIGQSAPATTVTPPAKRRAVSASNEVDLRPPTRALKLNDLLLSEKTGSNLDGPNVERDPDTEAMSMDDFVKGLRAQVHVSSRDMRGLWSRVPVQIAFHEFRFDLTFRQMLTTASKKTGDALEDYCHSPLTVTILLDIGPSNYEKGAFKIMRRAQCGLELFPRGPLRGTHGQYELAVKELYYQQDQLLLPPHAKGQATGLNMEGRIAITASLMLTACYGFMDMFLESHPTEAVSLNIPIMEFVKVGLGSGLLPSKDGSSMEKKVYLIEEYIDPAVEGRFHKYIGNGSTIPLQQTTKEDKNRAAFLSFTQHVQYMLSGKQIFLSDYQGGTTLLSDPQIMAAKELGSVYGDGNVFSGFMSLELQHVCNDFYEKDESEELRRSRRISEHGVSDVNDELGHYV
ncbi:unnamed protein product [Mycena citricolor]|uniref:Alpha-type protein kinase domain-containing protein n=1 Tax=Mycena citricolor TaxID=2018698 RepID=A0AAD2H2C4_9AGAR|nr:unnamed protein product [Mycena citricolor]